MKSLTEAMRDPEYNGQAIAAKLLAEAAQYIDGLEGDYANLKAERDALSAELAALREQEPPFKVGHAKYEEMAAAISTLLEERHKRDALREKLPDSLISWAQQPDAGGDKFSDGYDAAKRWVALQLGVPVEPSGNSEELLDWPEDRGEHPQKGVAK
jgi:hypothetical protein